MLEWYSFYGVYVVIGLAILLAAALIWLLVLSVRLNRAVKHYQRITRGVDGGDLKWILERELWRIQEAAEKTDSLERRTDVLAAVQERCIQHVGVVRFNPFQDTGGDQSFSVAMLDAHGDGLVLTGIYSRKETRFYVKPIQGNVSAYTLTPEEADAIRKAGGGQTA